MIQVQPRLGPAVQISPANPRQAINSIDVRLNVNGPTSQGIQASEARLTGLKKELLHLERNLLFPPVPLTWTDLMATTQRRKELEAGIKMTEIEIIAGYAGLYQEQIDAIDTRFAIRDAAPEWLQAQMIGPEAADELEHMRARAVANRDRYYSRLKY